MDRLKYTTCITTHGMCLCRKELFSTRGTHIIRTHTSDPIVQVVSMKCRDHEEKKNILERRMEQAKEGKRERNVDGEREIEREIKEEKAGEREGEKGI